MNIKGAFYMNAPVKVSFMDDEGNAYSGSVKVNKNNIPVKPYIFIKGKMEYANGDIYDGQWNVANNNNNNIKSGKGKMEYANGDIYEGSWRYDRRFKGKITYKNNGNYLEYDGQWEYNIPNGYGKLTYTNQKQVTGFYKYENGKFIINVDNSNANVKKLTNQVMATLIEDENIPFADVTSINQMSENMPETEVEGNLVPETEVEGNSVPEAEVQAKGKAKGMFASLKRRFGPVFRMNDAGYTTNINKFKDPWGGKSRKSRKARKSRKSRKAKKSRKARKSRV